MKDTRKNCCGNNADGEGSTFDLAVIGAGSAGFSAAIAAAERGARVALIGHGTIGGTCVNVGCIPSKTLIRAAETLYQAKMASRFAGIRAEAALADWSQIKAQKDSLVLGLRQTKYIDVLPRYETLTYVEGQAHLVPDGVRVNGDLIGANKVVIATGSHPSIPPIEGIEDVDYLTSQSAFELDELPISMIIIGGGVIGCEVGQMFSRLGVKVTIICRSRLLPQMEPEISAALEEYFREEGIHIICGASYESIEDDKDITLHFKWQGESRSLKAEKILVATGRLPNSAGMRLEETGIELSPGGGIIVDERMQTTCENIYAAGDVTGGEQYVYMAAYGAKIAALNALDNNSLRYDNSAMPGVVFTDPQVATVGLTEAAARETGLDVKTSLLPLEYVPRALAARDTRGLIKLVAEEGSDRLLGVQIIAPEGADTIQTAVLALKQGMTVSELAETIFPYLTTVEGLKLAAQSFDKDVSALSCCAG